MLALEMNTLASNQLTTKSPDELIEPTSYSEKELQEIAKKNVQSLPYVKPREASIVNTVLGLGSEPQKVSFTNYFTAAPSLLIEKAPSITSALSYSVPSFSRMKNAPVRPAVDVIATYMNTSDRVTNGEHMRSQAHPPAPGTPSHHIRSLSMRSKDSSADWGWFADIDSSSESWGLDEASILRRKQSADFNDITDKSSVHVLGDEQTNTRITAAHKAFSITTDGTCKVVSATVSIPKFRIVQTRTSTDRHAQYLITLKLGKELYADWRRYSEFGELTKTLDGDVYRRTQAAWRSIETRWFNRLEPSYLHQKCITLENFMRELMYESHDPSVLIEFLGGDLGKVNTQPQDPILHRPSAQLPKELRPPQPQHERELFEKMWAENFKRSCVDYDNGISKSAES